MEFVLEHGKPERTEAMKAGSDRHAQLEQEVSSAALVLSTHGSCPGNWDGTQYWMTMLIFPGQYEFLYSA